MLVIEGSIPNEQHQRRRLLDARFGNDPETGQPITLNKWID